MAYQGSTAASSVANPPVYIGGRIGGPKLASSTGSSTLSLGRGVWLYQSTDSSTLVTASGYFTDAYYLGMKQNDVVICVSQSSAAAGQTLNIAALGAVTTSGAGLSSTSLIEST